MSTKTTTKKRKQKNFFLRWLEDFGMRQLIGIIMVVAAILTAFGAIFMVEGLILSGLYVYLVAALLTVAVAAYNMRAVGKKSPVYKRHMINMIVMSVVAALTLAAIIYVHIAGIVTEVPFN